MGIRLNRKPLISAGIGLVAAACMLAPVTALATTQYHFMFDKTNGMTTSNANATQGGTMDITLNVTESNADTANGENHTHGLPHTVDFVFTANGQNMTETGTMINPTSESAAMKANVVGQQFSATYAVPVPTKMSGKVMITTKTFDMWQPNINGQPYGPDSDDPIGGSAMLNGTITPPGGGNLPEVPYAGLIPVLLAGGYLAYRYTKKARTN